MRAEPALIPANPQREFVEMQYRSLREEILALKSRVMYLQGLSIGSIPFILGASEKLNLQMVLIVSPVVIVMAALMLLFEQNSIMRAGRYLKDYVEPYLNPTGFVGWEEYLEKHPENRRAERFFAASAHLAFVIYYLLGTYLAGATMAARTSFMYAIWLVAVYLGGLAPAVWFFFKTFKIGTSMPYEGAAPPSREASR